MSFWSVAQCESQRERTAQRFLEQAGFETYLPMIRAKKRELPLFPAYLFVKVVDFWYSIDNTIGVIELLKSGDAPAKLPDKIISEIKGRERGGIVRLPKPRGLQIGDRVSIVRGGFTDHIGLFDGMSAKDRIFVLLDLLGRKVRVQMAQSDMRVLQ